MGGTDTSLAVPIDTLERTSIESDIDAIVRYASERDAETLVIGMPLSMSGRVGSQAESVQRFVDDLRQRTAIEIVTIDARLTTVEAARRMREPRGHGRRGARSAKGDVDAAAATVILQAWLDGRRRPSAD